MRSVRKNEPFRYWLPGREAELDADVLVRLEELPPLDQGRGFGWPTRC
jgi:hypothetical protein